MSITKEIYKEFEAIVGSENITDDPGIMAAYFNIEFAAVVLPSNTAEVQAVIKLCNRPTNYPLVLNLQAGVEGSPMGPSSWT